MRILILGGISDALKLYKMLLAEHTVIYSVKGITPVARLKCELHIGGFGGVQGLVNFLIEKQIDCLLDATHPYAVKISEQAKLAANYCSLPCFHYFRPPWQQQHNDYWIFFDSMSDLSLHLNQEANRKLRLFFTIGQLPEGFINQKSPQHDYIVRSVLENKTQGISNIMSKGPFCLEQEKLLFYSYQVDVLVSKNSGGNQVAAKIQVAREMGLPVYLLKRPQFESNHPIFSTLNAMFHAVSARSQTRLGTRVCGIYSA